MEERGRPRRSILGILLPLAVVVAIVAAVAAYVGISDVQRQVNGSIADLRRQFLPEFTDVTPTGGPRTQALLDGNLASWWEGEGDEPSLTLRFAPAVDLGVVGVTSGANDDDFPVFRRPARIRLTTQSGEAVTLDLADTREFQSLRVDLRDVTRLRLQVLDARGPEEAPVAIRELEFKELR
jgi:hypothetical protein